MVLIPAGFLLLAIFFLALVLGQSGAPTESSRWIFEIHGKKEAAVRSIQGPKLALVGGSNGLFGIHMERVARELEIPAVNLATNAGLTPAYLLAWSKRSLNPGDLVVLTLEYDHFAYPGKPNDVLIDYVWSRDPRWVLESGHWFRFIYSMSLHRLLYGWRGRLFPPAPASSAYNSTTITKWGDESLAVGKTQTPADLEWVAGLRREELSKMTWDPAAVGVRILEDFVRWCRDRGITVLFAWPGTIRPTDWDHPKSKSYLDHVRQFWEKNRVPVLGDAEEFRMEPRYFWDTVYHPNETGRSIRTGRLIELLKEPVRMWRSGRATFLYRSQFGRLARRGDHDLRSFWFSGY